MIGAEPWSTVTQIFRKIVFRNTNAIFNKQTNKQKRKKNKHIVYLKDEYNDCSVTRECVILVKRMSLIVSCFCVLHLQQLTLCVLSCVLRSLTNQAASIEHHFKVHVICHDVIFLRLYVRIFLTRYVTNLCIDLTII
jgi:hypothetical protein